MVIVKILQSEPQIRGDLVCYDTRFEIGSIVISETVFLIHWNLQNYLDQWQEGIERISEYNTSCLIVSMEKKRVVGEDEYDSVLRWLVLYKKNNKVIIQRLYFHDKVYDNYIGGNAEVTRENCYDYIPQYNQYYPISGDYPQVSWELSEKELGEKFNIKIVDENIDSSWYCPVASGLITIGSFNDEFKINVSLWSIEDYRQQWKEGMKRLQNNNSTCLIMWVAKPIEGMRRWLLYKRNGKMIFYQETFYGIDYLKNIGDILVTKKNCYDFIPTEQEVLEKYRVKEWEVDLKEFDGLEIVWPKK